MGERPPVLRNPRNEVTWGDGRSAHTRYKRMGRTGECNVRLRRDVHPLEGDLPVRGARAAITPGLRPRVRRRIGVRARAVRSVTEEEEGGCRSSPSRSDAAFARSVGRSVGMLN